MHKLTMRKGHSMRGPDKRRSRRGPSQSASLSYPFGRVPCTLRSRSPQWRPRACPKSPVGSVSLRPARCGWRGYTGEQSAYADVIVCHSVFTAEAWQGLRMGVLTSRAALMSVLTTMDIFFSGNMSLPTMLCTAEGSLTVLIPCRGWAAREVSVPWLRQRSARKTSGRQSQTGNAISSSTKPRMRGRLPGG